MAINRSIKTIAITDESDDSPTVCGTHIPALCLQYWARIFLYSSTQTPHHPYYVGIRSIFALKLPVAVQRT